MAYSNLTKAELWEGMAANSKAIADIARYQLGMAKGRIDPAMQAKLIRTDLKTNPGETAARARCLFR